MALVYTRRIAQFSGPGPFNVPVFTVPDLTVVVVRDVVVGRSDKAQPFALVLLAQGVSYGLLEAASPSEGTTHHELRQAMNAGDQLVASYAGSFCNFVVTGYVFRDVGPQLREVDVGNFPT